MESQTSNVPELFGLVLAGGSSTRMGQDKALIKFKDQNQLSELVELLGCHVFKVFVSAKKKSDYPRSEIIEDSCSIPGPLNGILSASKKFPKNAWLVLACDMPFINHASIQKLISNRDTKKNVTCYQNKSGQPEPLFAIYEPKALTGLLNFVAEGNFSPRDYILRTNSKMINAEAPPPSLSPRYLNPSLSL